MADCVSGSALKPTISSTTKFPGLLLHRPTSLYICASSPIDCKRKQRGQATVKVGGSIYLRGSVNPTGFKPYKARKEGVTSIASSSWDAAASSGDDENDNSWGWSPRDGFGLYPWDPSWQAMDFDDLQWSQEETITLFTSEGVVKLGSRIVPSRASYNERKYAQLRDLSRLRRYREEDYMDPKQGLCLGAIFNIAATNGLDMGRRFCVVGFCRSIEMLSDVVEDTVLEQGGEVVVAEKGSTTGLHEKLTMTVALPALWGVPPAFDLLNSAIRSGGGIVEKTYKKWEFF